MDRVECAVFGVQGKAQRPFHSKELQRSHVPQISHNPPCSELSTQVNVEYHGKSLWIMAPNWK
ncbi:MAG: hypothetical protein BGO99_06790 [Nitrosospira sp. 56-18]|nr:MAG: hypothetical protein BGO99_06790 [Nitrosospira sp. 56-18]